MDIIVYIISFLIILSKFFDCYTTSSQITTRTQEKNPIARILMQQFGMHTTIWVIFGLTIIIVLLSLWIIFDFYTSLVFKILFILIGLLVSMVQFAVAYTNKTKRLNFFTKLIAKIMPNN